MRARLSAWLRGRVQAALSGRREDLAEAGEVLRDVARAADDVDARIIAARRAIAGAAEEQALLSQPFTAQMTVDQAWRRHPRTRAVFSRHHLPGCDGCAVRFDETLGEAAAAYGLSLPDLLEELNALL